MNRQVLTGPQRTISHPRTDGICHELVLADGCHWKITAEDEEAISIVSQLGCVMQLRMASGVIEPSRQGNQRNLLVQTKIPKSRADCHLPLISPNAGVFVSTLCPCAHWNGPYINFLTLSLVFARQAQADGGVLMHGALAERDGMGVILAAPGGTGKTTASNRLPAPWRSLCDDATLVVRDWQGSYWAHPWPTWSCFQDGGPGGTWNVQCAVPLKGIFFLSRAVEDRVEKVSPGQTVNLLVESVKQASMFMEQNLAKDKEQLHALRLAQFNNLCDLVDVIPVYMLDISLTGAFWEEIERALAQDCDEIINRKDNNAD